MDKPSAQRIKEVAAISRTHAYDILAGRFAPPLAMALKIYRATQWKPVTLEGLAETTIDDLEAAKPWERAA